MPEQEAGAATADWPQALERDVLQMEGQVRRAGGFAKRLKALGDESAKVKKLLAEAMLDMTMPKDGAAKVRPPQGERPSLICATVSGKAPHAPAQ